MDTTLTATQLCKRWQISRATLDRKVNSNGIPKPFRVGNGLRWRILDIERYETPEPTPAENQPGE